MKTFCPNCEKETESTFICEVHCCNECDEDNGNYEKPLTTKLQSEIARLKELVHKLEPWYDKPYFDTTIPTCVYCEKELDWGKDLLGHKDDCEFVTRERG